VQDRKYENNQFYELTWPALNEGPFIVPNIHLYQYFNKNLPFDIIEIIISYLNFEEVFILALSKLFLPALFQIPRFFKKLNNFFLHTLCAYFTSQKTLYTYFTPIIYDNKFYFAFATYIIDQNISAFTQTNLVPVTTQFTNIFKIKFTSDIPHYPLLGCYSTLHRNTCAPCYRTRYVCDFETYPKIIALNQFCQCDNLWVINVVGYSFYMPCDYTTK